MLLNITFFASLYSPNKFLKAWRSDFVCIKPPLPSGLNLPPDVIFSAIFFTCTALSSKKFLVPNGNSGVFVTGFLEACLIILSTICIASSSSIGALFAFEYLAKTSATSLLVSNAGLNPFKNPLFPSNIL